MSGRPWKRFKEEVRDEVEEALEELGWPSEGLDESLEEPPDPSFGDLACTLPFKLPRKLKKSPQDISEELAETIEGSGNGNLIEEVEAEGGYVNFFVNASELTELTLGEIREMDEKYGHLEGGGEKVLIEHTSVNPTKPLHVGHGRNAILGDTMARILDAYGQEVEVQNYIDDLGLQVAQTLIPYLEAEEVTEEKFDHFLGKLYVDFHERAESDPKLRKRARDVLSKMEEGTGETAQKARNMALMCVGSNLRTSDRMNIDYDLLVWESDITKTGMLDEALEMLEDTEYLVEGEDEHEGALVLKLDDFGLEDKVMVRSDGTAVYTARDLAYQLWKFGRIDADLRFELHSRRPDETETYTTIPEDGERMDFGNADRVINVIGVEQKYPQRVIFAALKALGLEEESERSHHLAYDHVRLPSEKFSGREGTWIGYSVDKVLDESVRRAEEEVRKRNPEADEEFIERAAEDVGVGAVRYSLIRSSPEKEVVFQWEEALDFERNSGPAVQYSHARACSILRKAVVEEAERFERNVFETDKAEKLIKKISKFPEVVAEAGEEQQPHRLAVYASELSLLFNKFYEVAPVLDAKTEDLKRARLNLVKCTQIVLRNALDLLGIAAPERM